jgi:uncharacterized circularly permuted ATP-grasp superfamily protein/uncharacterized alpha-E superfamily protein
MAEQVIAPGIDPDRFLQTQPNLFDAYTVSPEAYDEVFTASGATRPHWDHVVPFLNALGSDGLSHRWDQARRMIHENGVTYNVYGQDQSMKRLWELDAIPWVIPPAEWAQLETALAQRARLLNRVLADVYSTDTLMQQGLLPPELIFASRGFHRPCHGIEVPNDCYLHLYAADLGRTPDGQWWVLADRAQSPAGAGYALENRLILSGVLADLFRECQVQRLASFFAALQRTLISIAPRHRDNPRIVLLTPGPYNQTYFEHAYLARYLGYTLVEGGDLTVRDQAVFIKTLAGLQPVDVIFRYLGDRFCDPLELQQDSLLGTAGLVQAVRAGNVAVANALGSGWLESKALPPLLPKLCRHLLGEDLLLPSVPTWWCGEANHLAYVLKHLESLIVTPVFSNTAQNAVFGGQLSRDERQRWADKIRARPYAYAAKQLLTLSHVPVWNGAAVKPLQSVLRVYVVATENGYMVMPGGLTRVASATDKPFVSMRGDSGSKDTWVLATGPTEYHSLLPPAGQSITIRRSGYEFPSRAADNLFWMGRYAERAEGLVRYLRSVLVRLTDNSKPSSSYAFPTLIRAMTRAWEGLVPLTPEPDRVSLSAHEHILLAAMFDPELKSSVRSSLSGLHHVSALVRDYMTLESWRIVTQLEEHFTLSPDSDRLNLSEALELLNHTIMILSAFSGLAIENMIRGPEWRFLDMGRRIERAMHTASVLRHTLVEVNPQEAAVLEALVEIADSTITYRSRYLTQLQCAPVVDLILTDDTNPRAVLYQLMALAEHVEHLPRDRSMPSLSPAQRLIMTMLTQVRLAEIDVLCQIGRSGSRTRLDALLTTLLDGLPALSDNITYHYLSHAELTQHLAQMHQTQEVRNG